MVFSVRRFNCNLICGILSSIFIVWSLCAESNGLVTDSMNTRRILRWTLYKHKSLLLAFASSTFSSSSSSLPSCIVLFLVRRFLTSSITSASFRIMFPLTAYRQPNLHWHCVCVGGCLFSALYGFTAGVYYQYGIFNILYSTKRLMMAISSCTSMLLMSSANTRRPVV